MVLIMVPEGVVIMKKVSFRVRNFEKEQFLTFDIDDDAGLDEELLDFLEDEEPEGIVPVIFEDGGDEQDTFSYNITDRIRLSELSNQEINAEMVLNVMRGLVLSLINMDENEIPLSYLVFNRDYIYIDSDYRVEFICIPLEDMQEKAEVNLFLRHLIATLRFDPEENGDYVAKLLTYVNNTDSFDFRNMLVLVEELMDSYGIGIPEDDSSDIGAEYEEAEEKNDADEPTAIIPDETAEETTEEEIVEEPEGVDDEAADWEEPEEADDEAADWEESEEADDEAADWKQSEEVDDEATDWEQPEDEDDEGVVWEQSVEVTEEKAKDARTDEEAQEIVEQMKNRAKMSVHKETKEAAFKTKEATDDVSAIQDELDEYLAEKEREDNENHQEIKPKKNIKVSRASMVKNSREEQKAAAEAVEELEEEQRDMEEPEDTETVAKPAAAKANIEVPKVYSYLVRVNTDERIMLTKQTFKLGKASMGVDYTVTGNSAVSRVHAIITQKDGIFTIKDNKSTNHTFVNGKFLDEGESAELTDGCKIALGNEEFIFKLG